MHDKKVIHIVLNIIHNSQFKKHLLLPSVSVFNSRTLIKSHVFFFAVPHLWFSERQQQQRYGDLGFIELAIVCNAVVSEPFPLLTKVIGLIRSDNMTNVPFCYRLLLIHSSLQAMTYVQAEARQYGHTPSPQFIRLQGIGARFSHSIPLLQTTLYALFMHNCSIFSLASAVASCTLPNNQNTNKIEFVIYYCIVHRAQS